jgi:hypothetical protein
VDKLQDSHVMSWGTTFQSQPRPPAEYPHTQGNRGAARLDILAVAAGNMPHLRVCGKMVWRCGSLLYGHVSQAWPRRG